MKNKALIGLIATATIGTAITIPVIKDNQNTTHIINKVLMVNNTNNSSTNEAVVINGNSNMNLYALSNGSGIVSNLSVGEMLTVLGQSQNGYCKVKVQETGAIGYVNVDNMQDILNGTNDTFTQLSGTGQVINVSSNVRLRSIPAIGNNIICHLTNGTSLNILGKQGQWYKVSVNGQIGFIYEEYVSTNITDSNSQSVTNNVNTNSENVSTSATSTSSSTNNTNSSNHVKNVVVRTKNSKSISNSIKSNSQNILREKNNNKLSNYLGSWKVFKNVGHSIEGINTNAQSLIGSKLEMTNNIYKFDGTTITNPYYYIQSVSAQNLFGQDGATGILKNQRILNRLIVSSKPLTSSEVKKIPLNSLNPTIILNNSNIYVFGGGKNHAQIYNTMKV